jgi:adenine-specific DNA-methyltransferase
LGEEQKFNERSLIQSRRPWYKMEQRNPPPILFAYLGRRDCRFIMNEAGVVPLTGFLCVYPLETEAGAVKKLWRALNHPATIQNLLFAGKSYGGGAVKVEPRQLDTLEIPHSVLAEIGLTAPSVATELCLLENASQGKRL